MEDSIRVFAAVHFFVFGLSHISQHRAWAEFFIMLRERGVAGGVVNGFLCLGFGALIVSFHNVWSGIPLVLTLIGWVQVLKGVFYFVLPSHGMRALSLVSLERSRTFIAPGIAFVGLGGLMTYSVIAA